VTAFEAERGGVVKRAIGRLELGTDWLFDGEHERGEERQPGGNEQPVHGR
jgi:hypothetical protein